MAFETIIFEKRENIGYVTFNRPEVLNAISTQLLTDLRQAINEIEQDKDIRVVIITGAGRAFMAGADISQLVKMNPLEINEWNHRIIENFGALEALKQPVIAAINGYALGGGLEAALCCDIRVASENARLGQPEVSLGIMPGGGGTPRLPRTVGRAKAMEMLLTGDMIDAQEAYRIGLVNKVVPEGQALKAAEEIAARILKRGPLATMLVKDAVVVGKDLPLDAAIEYAHKNLVLCFASEDAKEGLSAFLEKRSPEWKGK